LELDRIMTSLPRTFAQQQSRSSSMITFGGTAWMYPPADVDYALAHTTYTYRRVGNTIIVPDMNTLINIYTDIFNRTAETQPIGNPGYTLGEGTSLLDMGKEIQFKLPGGNLIITWRLMRQLTPQLPVTVIPNPGNSPNGTIGYIVTFVSYTPAYAVLNSIDTIQVLRTG